MSYFPKRVKRRRHSWVNNLGRKLVLLGAQGSHTEMFLCEYANGRRRWIANGIETARIVGWSKHYFLEVPTNNISGPTHHECSGRSMTACTVRGAKLMGIV